MAGSSSSLHENEQQLRRETIDRHRATASLMEELEWLRRRDPKLDEHLRTYLFTDKRILEIEEEAEAGAHKENAADNSGCLNIGSLRDR